MSFGNTLYNTSFVLHELEHKFKMNHARALGLLENVTTNELAYETQTHSHRTASKIAAEKEIMDIAIAQRLEELKKQPISWKQVFNSNSIIDEA